MNGKAEKGVQGKMARKKRLASWGMEGLKGGAPCPPIRGSKISGQRRKRMGEGMVSLLSGDFGACDLKVVRPGFFVIMISWDSP